MKDQAARLLDVKSLVTLIITSSWAFLAVTGFVSPDDVQKIFLIVVSFFFGTQYEKHKAEVRL